MDAVLTPIQQDRLVDMLVDASLVTQGRASVGCAPGTFLGGVQDAWRSLGQALPTTRLTVSPPRGDLPAVPGTAPELPPVRSGGNKPEAAESLDTSDALCGLTAVSDGAQVTQLVLDYSHLALDDRSADLLLRQLAHVAAGRPAAPVPDVTAYRAWLDGHVDAAATEKYWRTALTDLEGATPLFDETRRMPEARSTVWHELAPDVVDAANRVAADLGVSTSWLAMLAWAVIVARFRGGEPSAVGVLLDARPAELQDAVGVFETTVPLVVGLDRRPLRTWLTDQVAAIHQLHAAAHVTRAERNELAGQSGTVSLFDSTFDVRPQPGSTLPSPPVACTLRLDGDTLAAVYDAGIVPDELAERLVGCVEIALTELTAGDGTPADISLLDDEQRVAVQRHNATAAAYPYERCLHQLVEEQAARTPDAVALVHANQTLSYAEMNRWANRVAHDLIERGVRPDSIVGLCAEPGLELGIGILGILKAGAAYAPLDPFFPPDRLEYLYDDLDCSVVLVEQKLQGLLPRDEQRNVLLDPAGRFAGRPEDNPVVDVHPDNLAYVMYTSGSTGRPKGVLIEHGGAVNFVWWMRERFELRPDQAALQWTAYSFDAAVWELFWPLVVGARAVIAPGKIHLDIDRFIDLITANDVATLHFVPAMLQTFLSASRAHECESLRHVFVSGEPVPISLLRRFQDRLDADLINLYGVTEVSIDSTYYVCPRTDDVPFVRSGTPLSNTRTYVLDENLRPVPFGARGEVFIAGDSVTRGYLGRPGLAASRFVPDPFEGHGARMYRSGDIAQLLPDGNLHFLGRADHQVKIRGIRIELLEVAAGFNAFPAVRESLVVAFREGADRGLAAYVIAEEGASIDVAQLRAFVAEQMPPYMVPNAIIVLDEFPLNSNGKVDRPALPDPTRQLSGRESGRAPAGPVEEQIADIWCRLLELDTVGADEEFFSIGGNSLLATQVIADVRRTFGTQLALREWLEASTIAQLAEAIERHDRRDELASQVLDEVELSAG